ncbi:helix-turn-helix domain-containing protein [Halovulum sp. GXIMD14793]
MLKNNPQLNDNTASDLGAALRARRKELKLTMQRVADAAGLSVGFISQVERGLTAPSLGSLASLAAVLETEITSFLEQPSSAIQTTHEASRLTYSVADADVSYERLSTSFAGSKLHSVIVHEAPGHRMEPISHHGEEIFYIIDGEITVEIEGSTEILKKGASIHFDSRRVHSTWNHSTSTASILWCGTMNIFGDAPAPIHKKASPQEAATYPTGETEK